MDKNKQKIYALGTVILAILIGLILGEVVMQIMNYPNLKFEESLQRFRANKIYHHFHAPDEYYKQFSPDLVTGKYEAYKYFKYTQEGLRDLPEKKGVPKVLLIGDSFVEAIQVDIHEMFGNILEEKIGNVDIVNVGCASWSSLQYYLWVKNNIDKIKDYKAVFLFYFANDPFDTGRYVDESDNPQDPENVFFGKYFQGRVNLGDVSDMPEWKRWIRKNVKLYLLLSLTKKAIQETFSRMKADKALKGSWDEEGPAPWEVYFSGFTTEQMKKTVALDNLYIVKVKELLRAKGIDFSVVYIPVAYQVSSDENRLGREFYSPHYIDIIRDSTVFQDMLAQLANDNGFGFIDLTKPLKEYKSHNPQQMLYQIRDGHFNPAGHKAVAEILEPYIKHAISF